METLRRVWGWTALCALALTTAHAAPSDTLKVHSNRLFVPVTVNGMQSEALLDSAAEMTFMDPKLAAQLGLKPEGGETAKGSGGQTKVQFAKGVNIEAAGVTLEDMTVALLDMTFLSQKLVDSDLRIILGREFFDAGAVRIDIAGGKIHRLAAGADPAGVKLPLTSHRGIESLPCKVEGVATEADIDLGNGSEVLIGKAFAEQHGLLAPGRVVEHKEGGGIGGAVVRDIVVLSSLEVGGVKFENVRAAIDPQPTAGAVNIGTSILRRFVLVIDYPGRAVWFEPRP
jgi:Retroviral aspartyl protease.